MDHNIFVKIVNQLSDSKTLKFPIVNLLLFNLVEKEG